MPQRQAIVRRTFLALTAIALCAAVPTPKEHFGFTPGEDYKLANYAELTGYFKKLAASSDRIRLVEFGQSSEGRPMYVAFISSAENLKRLERYREINRRLALGLATGQEAAKLAAEGKAIVWIDSGLHATEVAPAQHAPHLAYRMLTGESDEIRRIRDNVILMQVPVINPDGLDMTASWYRQNLGTPHELAPLPQLYQKYAGHDNNRDWFMLNLPETRHVSRLLFREWFPHIVYNQHQVAPFPARIFIPPYAEPLNPHIPSAVMEGINLIGSAMKERFARENKPGAISYLNFDAWWNGGLRSAPAFHNMHGILTETALYQYATPRVYQPSEIPERFSSGIPAREPTVFYQRPWLGGRWALMDAVDYILTADFAILELAASRPDHFLLKAWQMASAQIEAGKKGGPYAYVIPASQPAAWAAVEMLRRMQASGVEVRRAASAFNLNGKSWAQGDYVLLASQPFRPYLVDLMEPQKYPEIRSGATGPTRRPYDLAGWTLPFQMGVQFDRIDQPIDIRTEAVADIVPSAPPASWFPNGGAQRPRVALYSPYTANIDTGWTQWVLDYFHIDHSLVRNDEIRAGALRRKYDAIILAQQSMASILHGSRQGESQGRADWQSFADAKNAQRPEFTGGIGLEGARNLQEFVEQGGTLVTLDSASELPLELFPIGVRGLIRAGAEGESSGAWYCPGSILRITTDPAHPLAAGMPKEAYATSTGGQAFEITVLPEFNKGEREVKAAVWYASKELLASGWLSGERVAAGKAAVVDARLGQGHVVLFGFRPQFRGQSFGTFRLLFNALGLSVR
ncbi:MAG: hypothetical protein HY858_02340 [Candidatus Solibacter usitatus]|nr:hypothetical protein [Candidatus Solibacter usitatus]